MTTAFALASLLMPSFQTPYGSDVFVPESSIRREADAGIRAHTCHLIYTGTDAPRHIDPPTEELLHGPLANTYSIAGYTPLDILTAYGVPAAGGSGAIAIIDAYHYPTALNDFNVFSRQFNLSAETSTNANASTNKVFQVVFQGSNQPPVDPSWSEEAALDIEWAHAMSRYAKIYLVEANSSSLNDLFAAVQKAKKLPGVRQISMSFSAPEFPNETLFDNIFTGAGITFYAAAGDTGGISGYPATSPNVVAVGGTSLDLSPSNRVMNEDAWTRTGGGVSLYERRPSYQDGMAGLVGLHRGVPDLALDADPATGCAVYDSTDYNGYVGWMVFGGTSLATPSLAGIANVSGRNFANSQLELQHIYHGLGTSFRDIVTGGSGKFLAGQGWDFCTGVGCPRRASSL